MISIFIKLLLKIFISADFLLLGAKIAKIEKRTFLKAFGIMIISQIVFFVSSFFLVHNVSVHAIFEALYNAIGSFYVASIFVGVALGYVPSFLITVLLMLPIFSTTLKKALLAALIAWTSTYVIMHCIDFILRMTSLDILVF